MEISGSLETQLEIAAVSVPVEGQTEHKNANRSVKYQKNASKVLKFRAKILCFLCTCGGHLFLQGAKCTKKCKMHDIEFSNTPSNMQVNGPNPLKCS